jgi:hypothetical protein
MLYSVQHHRAINGTFGLTTAVSGKRWRQTALNMKQLENSSDIIYEK